MKKKYIGADFSYQENTERSRDGKKEGGKEERRVREKEGCML